MGADNELAKMFSTCVRRAIKDCGRTVAVTARLSRGLGVAYRASYSAESGGALHVAISRRGVVKPSAVERRVVAAAIIAAMEGATGQRPVVVWGGDEQVRSKDGRMHNVSRTRVVWAAPEQLPLFGAREGEE